MNATFGHLSVLLALAASLVGLWFSVRGGVTGDRVFARRGQRAAQLTLLFVALATGIMIFALVTHDFTVKYVQDVGSRETPLYYTIISLWASLEGSILYWSFLLSVYTVAFLRWGVPRLAAADPVQNEGATRGTRLGAWSTAILLAISAFFLYVIAGPGNPFQLVPTVRDGPGPNPLLQNHWMMGVHPQLLYLGYVGLSVPFAIAMAALIVGWPGPDIFRLIRRWALIPWLFLSLGIVAGMWWAYAVLGWGGYWSWDPVENTPLMPWLVTTAFLHSLQVQERRQMLKAWTISLIIVAFLLTILGTFITRSGVIESVHSFTESSIGPVFLAFLAACLVGSLSLLFARSKSLAAPGALESALCRETAFLANNLILVVITFTVLLGTLFPLLTQAVNGSQVSVGAPYFDNVAVPLSIALLFLMGVGPLLPWGAARLDVLQWRLLGPVLTGVLLVLALMAVGVRGTGALATFGLAMFVLAVTLGRIVSDVRVRRSSTKEAWLGAAGRLVSANPRRYGGYLAHIGVLLVVVGIASSQSYAVRGAATLRPGQSATVDGYTFTYRGLQPHPQPNRMVMAAAVSVNRAGENLGTFYPSQNYYPRLDQPVVTPAVREEPLDMLGGLFAGHNPATDLTQLSHGRNPFEDMYLVLQAFDGSHANAHNAHRWATIQILIFPLVGLIWLGGGAIGLGALFALLPARRRQRATVAARQRTPLVAEEAVR